MASLIAMTKGMTTLAIVKLVQSWSVVISVSYVTCSLHCHFAAWAVQSVAVIYLSTPHTSRLTEIFCTCYLGHGSVLLLLQRSMLCRPTFCDNFMFSHNRAQHCPDVGCVLAKHVCEYIHQRAASFSYSHQKELAITYWVWGEVCHQWLPCCVYYWPCAVLSTIPRDWQGRMSLKGAILCEHTNNTRLTALFLDYPGEPVSER